jgi:hypothetical protein
MLTAFLRPYIPLSQQRRPSRWDPEVRGGGEGCNSAEVEAGSGAPAEVEVARHVGRAKHRRAEELCKMSQSCGSGCHSSFQTMAFIRVTRCLQIHAGCVDLRSLVENRAFVWSCQRL